MKCTFHYAWQIFGSTDSVDALAKGTTDFELIRIQMEIHFLMRMPAVIIRLNITDDGNERNRIQCCVRKTCYRVRQSRPDVKENHSRLSGRSRIPVSRVRCELFMAGGNKSDPTPA